MPEVADAREDHRDAGVVGGFDHVFVFFAAARLHDRGDARARGDLHAVGEREERVGGEDRTLGALARFLAGDLHGGQTARVTAAFSQATCTAVTRAVWPPPMPIVS